MKFSKFGLISLICACCIGTGILAGAVVLMLQPKTQPNPLLVRANTSDRVDGYLTCTGYVEGGLEAVYVLDSTTGILSVGVLSRIPQSPGFQAIYQGNVNADLEKVILTMSKVGNTGRKSGRSSSSSKRNRKDTEDAVVNSVPMIPSEPKYIITSGTHDMVNQGSGFRPAVSALYVTECNTGITLVYVLRWNPSAHSANQQINLPLTFFTFHRFLTPMVMEEGVEVE